MLYMKQNIIQYEYIKIKNVIKGNNQKGILQFDLKEVFWEFIPDTVCGASKLNAASLYLFWGQKTAGGVHFAAVACMPRQCLCPKPAGASRPGSCRGLL